MRRDKRNGPNSGNVHDSPARGRGAQNPYGTEGANAPLNPGMAVIEESAESLLDASDLSFDDTQGDILDGSRQLRNGKRRSSTNIGGNRRSIIRKSAGKCMIHFRLNTGVLTLFPSHFSFSLF